jgi:NADH-quinone oxidoreductase subunit N
MYFDSAVFNVSKDQVLALAPYATLCLGILFTTIAAGIKAGLCTHRVLLVVFFAAFSFLNAASLGSHDVYVFGTSLFVDDTLRWVGLGLGVLGLIASLFVLEKEHGEWSTLMLVSVLGLAILPGARDWVAFFVYLETLAIPGYIMASFRQKQDGGFEAGLKYLLMGAFASALLLMGMALVFGAAGSFDYSVIREVIVNGLPSSLLQAGALLILVSLAFKVALVPVHMWAADVYQSAPIALAAFLAGAGKLAVFSAALLAFSKSGFLSLKSFQTLILVFAVLSIVVGNLMALTQKYLRRTLAYSSVASAGYAAMVWRLSDVSQPALFVYLFTYALGFLLAFACLEIFTQALRKPSSTSLEFSDLSQIVSGHSKLGVFGLTLALFSMAGIPPLPGFLGKYFVIVDLWRAGHQLESFWILLGSLMGLAYYLRILVPLYLDNTQKVATIPARGLSQMPRVAVIVALLLMFVGLGVFAHYDFGSAGALLGMK